jgi:hypothetical protein
LVSINDVIPHFRNVVDADNYPIWEKYRKDWRRHYEALTINVGVKKLGYEMVHVCE